MRRRASSVWGLAVVLAAACPAGAEPPPAPAETPSSAAAAYRAALAPVTSCAAFAGALGTLPEARPLMRALFNGGVPVEAAGEGRDAFVDRVVRHLFATLGDPSRLYLRIALGGAARYDPARGAMVVRLPQPFEAALDHWGGQEIRMRGGTRLVTDSELRAAIDFPPGAIPPEIVLPMAPEDAARFPRTGRLQTLSLFEDYGTDAAHRAAAGPGHAAVQTSYRLVRLQPKCATITNGGPPLAGWSYDGWSAAAPGS